MTNEQKKERNSEKFACPSAQKMSGSQAMACFLLENVNGSERQIGAHEIFFNNLLVMSCDKMKKIFPDELPHFSQKAGNYGKFCKKIQD